MIEVRWSASNRRASMITKTRDGSGITRLVPRLTTVTLVLSSLLVLAVVATQPAQAQTLHTLHAFRGTDGGYPWGPLIRDPSGNLYGTTYYGGTGNFGTVFKLD